MRFWQVFEAYRPSPPQKVFGHPLPNWKTDMRDAEAGLKLHLDGNYPDYAHVYINFAGTIMCDVNNSYQVTARTTAELEDKLRDLGIIRYCGYDDTH
jgi:hypothetical protein